MIRAILIIATCITTAFSASIAVGAPAGAGPAAGEAATTGNSIGDEAARAADRERAWATRPEIMEAAAYAKRGEAPPGAIEAAEQARAELLSRPGTSATTTALRDNIYYAAKWYYDYQTITYTWSDYWTPCNMYEADCECFNRLAYWDGGWGQLWYTLRGQATTGFYTRYPQYGDLVFFDYDGDGWEGPTITPASTPVATGCCTRRRTTATSSGAGSR